MKSISISEIFQSLQGEGPSIGQPAVFIRAAGCNLRCNGKWKCDTWNLLNVEQQATIPHVIAYIYSIMKEKYPDLLLGYTKLIFTGGEPFLPSNAEFFSELIDRFAMIELATEIETNGTVMHNELYNKIKQINCSPKLSNSGIAKNDRFKPDILHKIAAHPNSNFKFVVADDEDLLEVADIVDTIKIPHNKVYLMPAATTRAELQERLPFVWEAAQKMGFFLSTRLQIETFNTKTGV